MMKKIICPISLVLVSFTLCAQSLTPEVVGSAGTIFSNDNLSLEWTLGEIMTETFSENITLTQGFHQSSKDVRPVNTIDPSTDNQIVLYPNPATSTIKVHLPPGAELMGLLSVTGRNTGLRFRGQGREVIAKVAGLPTGLYFLHVQLANGDVVAHRLVVY